MLSPEKIIEQIQSDAPCVYDILHEQCFPNIRSKSYPQSDSQFAWDDFFKANPDIERPTASQLLEELCNYNGDNWDVHFWHGRYSQMLIDNKPIRIPMTESDLEELRNGETFLWSFGKQQQFIFNTDIHPELDPDSDEYDDSICIEETLSYQH